MADGKDQTALHDCSGELPSALYGDAITGCHEDADGKLWVGNGEYASQVAYCPYCGFAAVARPEVKYE